MTLGNRIRLAREEHGYRLQDIAVALLTTPATVARMEQDLEDEIPVIAIEKLAHLTGYQSSGDFLAKCENYAVDLERNMLLIRDPE
jgi:transcriptional regulator with XRE-family HTH domain